MAMGFGKQAKRDFNHIKAIILWIKNQDTESILGITDGFIKVILKTINEMALDNCITTITH